MPFHRIILRWGLGTAVIYAALALPPWPGLRQGYRSGYMATARLLWGRVGSLGQVRFQPAGDDHSRYNVDALLRRRGLNREGVVKINSTTQGLIPSVELLALILAMPVPWPRKWRSILVGLALVQFLVMARLAFPIMEGFSRPSPLRIFDLTPFWYQVLTKGGEFFFIAPSFGVIMPVLVWALVTLRKEDLERLVSPRPATTTPHES